MAVFNNPPSRIDYKNVHFLIMDAPSESNLLIYLTELRKQHATDVVRVCDPTYNPQMLEKAGIKVHVCVDAFDMPFADGEAPPSHVIDAWLDLCADRFENCPPGEGPSNCIAIHCVAGLGRAPVLVAIALMEQGLEAEDAVHMIRRNRKGAINSKQLRFLQKYKPRSQQACCVIS